MTYDVRAIANFVLDCGDKLNQPVSNMALNKIVYFLHGWYLVKTGEPLVSAKIEAWQHGPVFRELYSEFKVSGRDSITVRAKKIDPIAGKRIVCSYEFQAEDKEFLYDLVDKYVRMTAANLREMSHIYGGPWDQVFNHREEANPGMRISDAMIREFFEHQTRH